MIVLDNSVIVPRYVVTASSEKVHKVLDQDRFWVVPPLWKFEFSNALVNMLREGSIDDWIARDALARAHDDLLPAERPVDQIAVIRTAHRLKISGYDAQYIALATHFDLICVTRDKQLAVRAGTIARLVI